MTFEVEREMSLMKKYGISYDELLLLKVLLLYIEEENNNIYKEYMLLPSSIRGSFREKLISLQSKGIILKSYEIPALGQQFYPEDIEFNKNFLKCFYRESFTMGKELYQVYPPFVDINNVAYSLRSISKKFDSIEEFYKFYGKEIRYNDELHKEIIKLIEWAKTNTNFLNFNICEFVISHKWEELKMLKDGKISNYNFGAIKSI